MTTLTPADVAADLHLSKEAIHRHLRAGTIPSFKVGRAYRIDPDDYAAWKQGAHTDDPNRIPPRTARGDANLRRARIAS